MNEDVHEFLNELFTDKERSDGAIKRLEDAVMSITPYARVSTLLEFVIGQEKSEDTSMEILFPNKKSRDIVINRVKNGIREVEEKKKKLEDSFSELMQQVELKLDEWISSSYFSSNAKEVFDRQQKLFPSLIRYYVPSTSNADRPFPQMFYTLNKKNLKGFKDTLSTAVFEAALFNTTGAGKSFVASYLVSQDVKVHFAQFGKPGKSMNALGPIGTVLQEKAQQRFNLEKEKPTPAWESNSNLYRGWICFL
eukprot:TRINITY_DN5767_c0_g1_i1.p2 TRINITY_DN5767_c0_g1~~TRINITY_DN5767_c0_g1_i1.p2  ORF type:complete len:251 (+),score=54.57 TRINITY_DN5767_c0_g1_i1:277-1029(+)